MSRRKSRGAKALPEPPKMDSPNLSATDRENSFMEGLQRNCSNPLHSTAIEEDLDVVEDGRVNRRMGGRGKIPKTAETDRKQRGAAVKRKKEDDDQKERKKSSRVKARSSSEKETPEEEEDTPADIQRSAGKKLSRRSGRLASAARKSQQLEDKKRETLSDEGDDGQSEEEGRARHARRLPSSDEEADEDTSWKPSPKAARMPSLGRTRKSSSGEAGGASGRRKRRAKPAGRGATDLEVVLDAFLEFCDQHRESVESTAVQRSILCFFNNVEEQLLEKISSRKELGVLRRENKKVASLIHKKTQRLLDAKHELMRAERQVWLLQKDKAELQQRLTDLKQGQAFLHDIRALSRKYLEHRCTNPTEKETYGASSLPALLLETKLLQPSAINNQLEKGRKINGSQK